jgi:hypothetical protein
MNNIALGLILLAPAEVNLCGGVHQMNAELIVKFRVSIENSSRRSKNVLVRAILPTAA